MRKIVLLLIGVYLFSFSLFTSRPKIVIYVNENNAYAKIVKYIINKLKKDDDFKFIMTDNNAILSLIEENQFYTNQVKLIDGLNADPLLRKDAIYDIFTINYMNNTLLIRGIKYIKNEKVYRLHLKLKVSNERDLAKNIYKLIVFFLKSEIPNTKAVNRSLVSPFVIKTIFKEKVIYYANKKVVLNDVLESNIELAKKLKLITTNDNAKLAKEYCDLLDKDVANRLFSKDGDIVYEDYLDIFDYKKGFKVYTYKIPKTNKDTFKCIGNETMRSLDFDDYILTKLGLLKREYYKYSPSVSLSIEGVYGYFYNNYDYKLNINHVLKFNNKEILNNVKFIDATYDMAFVSDGEFLYKVYKDKIVKKLRLKNIRNIKLLSSHVIVSTNDGKIYVFNLNLKVTNTILPIGIFFYNFEEMDNNIIAYNSNGYRYIFLKNKFLGEK